MTAAYAPVLTQCSPEAIRMDNRAWWLDGAHVPARDDDEVISLDSDDEQAADDEQEGEES